MGATFLEGDDTKLATVGQDRTLRIWDLPRGFCLRTVELPAEGSGVACAKGTIISSHRDGSVSFLDDRSNSVLNTHKDLHSRPISNISVENAGNELITASLDHTLKIFDLTSHRILQTFSDENFKVSIFGSLPTGSPNGKYLAAGSADGLLYIWNRAWGAKIEAILEGHR